jgi:hypothetical protein
MGRFTAQINGHKQYNNHINNYLHINIKFTEEDPGQSQN